MKLLKNTMFIEIVIYIIGTLISLGISVLIIMALIKYIFG